MNNELSVQDIATLLYFVDEELKRRKSEIVELGDDDSFETKAIIKSTYGGIDMFEDLKNKLESTKNNYESFIRLERNYNKIDNKLNEKVEYYIKQSKSAEKDGINEYMFFYDGMKDAYKEVIEYLRKVVKYASRS